jgi:phosphopantothenoylcysteine decarboxylase/phosphopantothenate--cysteine ligase
MKILLGVCGSVSAYKAPWIVRELRRAGAEVKVVLTESATQFVTPLALQNTSQNPVIVRPFAESIQSAGSWHVELAHWCDLALVAPCSANTLAKLAHGLADTALSLVLLSFPHSKPIKLAPAMDPDLWLHPATRRNVALLEQDGVEILSPEVGEMASGMVGPGRLAEPVAIVDWALKRPWKGKKVLVTAGPTRERIDAVRFLSNDSSGKMGFAIAAEAAAQGARVVLVTGPVALSTPTGVERIGVESAAEMLTACQAHYADCDLIIKAAAVADFTPRRVAQNKLKKEDLGSAWSLEMDKTADILAWLGAHKKAGQTLVGFALETDQGLTHARRKLEGKNCDFVVLNLANQPDSGFSGDNNTISLLSAHHQWDWPAQSKRSCARELLKQLHQEITPASESRLADRS